MEQRLTKKKAGTLKGQRLEVTATAEGTNITIVITEHVILKYKTCSPFSDALWFFHQS